MKYIRSWGLSAMATAMLAACGGGGGDDAPPARGTIVTAQLAGTVTTAQINAGTAASGLQALSGAAKCGVDVRYVLYVTRDAKGTVQTASEGIFVPNGSDAACTGSRPVLLYAHGTNTSKSFNMADVSVNTSTGGYNNAAGAEASLEMAMYAAQGFIVVMPNYLGYDKSSAHYHPYLNAEAQAVDMVDGLRAAMTHLNADSAVKPSSKLLISGYSEGGFVAMATHKIIERDYASEFTVTAGGPMSGPYNLAGTFDVGVGGQASLGSTIFLPLTLTSYQMAYGDVYTAPSDIYQSPFDQYAETLFPTDTSLAALITPPNNKLPADPTFTNLFGTGGLLKDSFRTGYTTSNFRNDALKNTLTSVTESIGWTPKAAVAVCGGANDPTVFWAPNAPIAQQVFASKGVMMPAFNLENRSSLPAGATGDLLYGGFQQAKAAAGANAVAQYHGSLVPPFCNAMMRGFFQQVLAVAQ